MATEELVTEQFQFLGIDVEKEVLLKCVTLCEEYNVDAETFSEQWVAFSLTHLNGASPTLENLDLLEKKELSKLSTTRSNAHANESLQACTGTSLAVYGAPISTPSDNNDVLSNYMSPNTKRIKKETEQNAPQKELRPATYSPTVCRSAKYASRTNQGSVIHSFGDENFLQENASCNAVTEILDLSISRVANDDGELYDKCRCGFELLHDKATLFDNHIRYISQCIKKKNNIKESMSVRHKSQTEVFVEGRIQCDADARLNAKSVVLQGTWEQSLSQAVAVDLDSVKQYSLFPGQVVVMRGLNPRGDKFLAQEVFHDASNSVPNLKADILNTLKGTIAMVVVAGPYTTSDSLSYEPLKDLIAYIIANKPHVVIMTGPFMDCEHPRIKDDSLAEIFNSFFNKLIDSISELSTTSPLTKIYIVSSLRDAFHLNIYPTPAYSSRRKYQNPNKYKNINFLPDPCALNINGVIIGVTSSDILMDISKEEISQGMGGDKLTRLASHVLAQQSYYPLWPPPSTQPVDAVHWASHAQLSCTPHILVLPSNFRYFIKEVNKCVVVNPEHLTKGTGGGTFARLLIAGHDELPKIGAQIVRI